jgi:6-phosphogluconolactonase
VNYTLWIGSYAKKEEPGIYKVSVDTENEKLNVTGRYAGVENPSFLAEADGYLFAASEAMNGQAALLQIDEEGVNVLAAADAGEMAPCHIYAEGTSAWTANYGGSVTKFERKGDSLVKTAFVKREGSGPNQERQDAPHVHSITPFPDRKHLLVCDLGTDTLAVYEKMKLELVKEVKTAPGSGPRMVLFHPELPVVYAMNELDSTVSVYKVGQEGDITHLDTISALPDGYNGKHTGADLQLSSDNRFLYASVRGWDGFAVFDVEGEGTLSQPRHVGGEGKTPRSFYVLPDAPYLIAAYQDSNNVTLFKLEENGLPVYTGNEITIKAPVCVIKKGAN